MVAPVLTMPLLKDDMTRKVKQKGKQASNAGAADNVATLPLSPGQKLRQAREKAGLTEGEIAERLFLHVGFVTHLENDAFDQLPGPTFVKGYIKSYCRLVNLSPDPLIALYKEHCPDQEFADAEDVTSGERSGSKVSKMTVPQNEAMPDFKAGPQSKRKVNYVPHFLGILMVSAGIVWVASEGDFSQPNMALNRLLPGLAQSGAGHDASDAELPQQQSEDGGTLLAGGAPEGLETTVAIPVTATAETGGQFAGAQVVLSPPYPAGMAVSYQIQLPANTGDKTHRLKLTFLEKAHVLVSDGSGAEAHNEVHARGAEVRVALLGRPPYQLALSRTAAVKVSFDGEPLSLPLP